MILDETDRALLRLLQQDADQSAASLAKNLDMSQPAIWRRIKRLKEEGVIKGVLENVLLTYLMHVISFVIVSY